MLESGIGGSTCWFFAGVSLGLAGSLLGSWPFVARSAAPAPVLKGRAPPYEAGNCSGLASVIMSACGNELVVCNMVVVSFFKGSEVGVPVL